MPFEELRHFVWPDATGRCSLVRQPVDVVLERLELSTIQGEPEFIAQQPQPLEMFHVKHGTRTTRTSTLMFHVKQ